MHHLHWNMQLCVPISLGICILVLSQHVLSQPSPSPALAQGPAAYKAAQLQSTVTADVNYVQIQAQPSDNDNSEPCATTVYPVNQVDLVNLDEKDCSVYNTDGLQLPYINSEPFGISWKDESPLDCSIRTVTITLQAGFSCSDDFGSTTLNNFTTPSAYRFPYLNEYDGYCDCRVGPSTLQVFNFHPASAYNQSGVNTFMMTNSTGSNGLRSFGPNATTPLFGLVILNQWVEAESMNVPRTRFGFATTLNGTVLAAGGVTVDGKVTNTAEEYFAVDDIWRRTATNLTNAMQMNQIAALNDVDDPDSKGAYYLVSAGGVDQEGRVLNSTEQYSTATRKWTATPSMDSPRAWHTLTSLMNGTRSALAIGGINGTLQNYTPLASMEYFSWDQNTWNPGYELINARFRHQTVLLNDWTALVMGGQGQHDQCQVCIFSNQAQEWLGAGGWGGSAGWKSSRSSQLLASCELYVNGTWYPTGNLSFPRAGHRAVLGEDGSVVVMGGEGGTSQTASELWSDKRGLWVTIAPIPMPNIGFGVASLQEGILAFGGSLDSSLTNTTGTLSSFNYTAPFSPADLDVFYKPVPPPLNDSSPQLPGSDVNLFINSAFNRSKAIIQGSLPGSTSTYSSLWNAPWTGAMRQG